MLTLPSLRCHSAAFRQPFFRYYAFLPAYFRDAMATPTTPPRCHDAALLRHAAIAFTMLSPFSMPLLLILMPPLITLDIIFYAAFRQP